MKKSADTIKCVSRFFCSTIGDIRTESTLLRVVLFYLHNSLWVKAYSTWTVAMVRTSALSLVDTRGWSSSSGPPPGSPFPLPKKCLLPCSGTRILSGGIPVRDISRILKPFWREPSLSPRAVSRRVASCMETLICSQRLPKMSVMASLSVIKVVSRPIYW